MKELNINNKQNKNKRKQRKLNFPPFFFSQAGTRKRTRRDEIKIIINIASTRATVSRTQWWPYKPVTILCALSLLCNCRRLEVLVKYGSNELRVIQPYQHPSPIQRRLFTHSIENIITGKMRIGVEILSQQHQMQRLIIPVVQWREIVGSNISGANNWEKKKKTIWFRYLWTLSRNNIFTCLRRGMCRLENRE